MRRPAKLLTHSSWLLVGLVTLPALGRPLPPGSPWQLSAQPVSVAGVKTPNGHPKVILNRLSFPMDVEGAPGYVKYLKHVLRHQVREVDWGAGRDNTIEYRFAVTKLDIHPKDGAVEVSCTAVGRLPKGHMAKSHLVFGGDPHHESALVKRVLEIVARGVVSRLADMERRRRGL